jgi:hypothetical protein
MAIPLVQIRCRSLRSKSSYGPRSGFQDDLLGPAGATATYWCMKTMGKAGPDEHFVHRSVCVEGRSCWESSDNED